MSDKKDIDPASKMIEFAKHSWVQNKVLFSTNDMNATQVNSYWRYVVKREQKAAKYHQDLNAGRHNPYYNKNMP